jgi:hypothetical protein
LASETSPWATGGATMLNAYNNDEDGYFPQQSGRHSESTQERRLFPLTRVNRRNLDAALRELRPAVRTGRTGHLKDPHAYGTRSSGPQGD